jgi:N-acetyl-anhydromuramyl-L-alanine amidase AmpD
MRARGRGVAAIERVAALADLAAIGYCAAAHDTAALAAFQRRFRQERWDGRLDGETATRLAEVRAAYDAIRKQRGSR